MRDQTADMLERALRRNHSGDWPLVMPSDILALVENFRHKSQRIADLERERELLLAYVRAERALHTCPANTGALAELDLFDAMEAAWKPVRDAGLLEDEHD